MMGQHNAVLLNESVAATCHVWQLGSMGFEELLEMVGDEPLFETGFLQWGLSIRRSGQCPLPELAIGDLADAKRR